MTALPKNPARLLSGSLIISILGAIRKLDTEPVDQNDEALHGGGEGGLWIAAGTVGSASAGIADFIYIIQSSRDTIDEICGAIAEIISVIRGVISLINTSVASDRSTSEKVIKALIYCADILAGTTGTIGFITTISNPHGALPFFIAEVCIRGVRFIGSLTTAITDWCQTKDMQDQEDSSSPAAAIPSPETPGTAL